MKKKRPKISYRELMRGEEEATAPASQPATSATPPAEPTLAAPEASLASVEPPVAPAEPNPTAEEPNLAAAEPTLAAAEPTRVSAELDAEDLSVSRVDWRVVPDVIETPTLTSSEPSFADARAGVERRSSAFTVRAPVDDAPPAPAATATTLGVPFPTADVESESPLAASLAPPPRHVGRTFVLLFRVGAERFAMSLASVDEAVDLPDVHALPEMPDGMLGVFNLRGRMMPLFSPLRALGVTVAIPPRAALVIHGRDQMTAVAVDDVDDVLEIDMAALHHAPGAGDADGVLLGIVHCGGDLIAVVNAMCVVSACEPVRTAEVA